MNIKKEMDATVVIRVTKETRKLVNELQKIIAVESNGEVLSKTQALEIVLKEFIKSRGK